MDRPPPEDHHLPRPIPRGHRMQHGLHDPHRRHGANRYEPYARDPHNHRPAAGPGAHLQYYQHRWETVNNRWIWLRPVWNDRTLARCIACQRTIGANIHTIQVHERSNRHNRSMENINVPVDEEFDPHLTQDQFDDEVATIKILLAAYFASEGIPYIKINTLLPLIKRIARHPSCLQEVKFTRWDLSKVNSGVIAPEHKRDLAETLSETKFTILFDESTGISNDKHGCLLVRFADHRSYMIRTVLWDLIPIYREDDEHSNETAAALYRLIIIALFNRPIAIEENRVRLEEENLMASTTDGCNTMIGVNNSVALRLRDNFEGIIHVTCPCHQCHLCGSHSIVECPIMQQLLIALYNWFCSAKRLHALQQNQIRLDMDVHKILRLVVSRWLTFLPAIIRVDEQIEAIDATLAEYPLNPQAIQLLMLIRSPIIRCLIAFFKFILEVVEDLNGWLQTEEVILPEIYARITTDFKYILECYMVREHVRNADLLVFDTENEEHFLPDNAMLIGDEAREMVNLLPHDQYLATMRVIRQYLIHLAAEWLERLVVPWAPFQCVECLLIENALTPRYHIDNPLVIHQLVQLFPRALPQGVNEEIIQNQWDLLIANQVYPNLPPDIRTDYLWFTIRDIENEEGRHLYRDLADFCLNVLSTPHSNAQSERTWSFEKYIKNKYRNLMSLKSVRANIQIRECLVLQGCYKEVYRFQPTAEMIRRVIDRDFHNPNVIPVANENDSDIDMMSDEEDEANVE